MKVIIFGATGMVGSGVLRECLDDARVSSIVVVGRNSVGMTSPKLQELIHKDFFDFTALQPQFAGADGCLFCLGVSAVGKTEADYHRMTYDVTLAAARGMVAVAPAMTFCYVSGAGTDSTEHGRAMWARMKGKTENALLALGFKAAYMFRPGFIQPLKGVRSKTAFYQAFYDVLGPLIPLMRRLLPGHVTTSVILARAMIRVVEVGYSRPIIEMRDIDILGA